MSRPRVQSLIKLTYWTFSVGSVHGPFPFPREGEGKFLKSSLRVYPPSMSWQEEQMGHLFPVIRV